MDRDHVRGVPVVGSPRVCGKLDVAPPKGTIAETQVKYGTTMLKTQEAFVEVDTSGKGGGEDQVTEMRDLVGDHFTSLQPKGAVPLSRPCRYDLEVLDRG